MGEPYKDDTCTVCGSYNNDAVVCVECLFEMLEDAEVEEEKIRKIKKEVFG